VTSAWQERDGNVRVDSCDCPFFDEWVGIVRDCAGKCRTLWEQLLSKCATFEIRVSLTQHPMQVNGKV